MYGGYVQIGRTGVLRIPAATNQAITAILPNIKRLSSEYLLHVLNYNVGYWRTVASSSRKDPNITKADVKAFPLILPSLSEQHAIAADIDDADELTMTLERLITKKQAVKQGLMQQLLTGRIRMPGFAGPWKRRRLSDLLSYEQPWPYLVHTAKQLDSGRVPVLTAGKTFVLGYTNESHGVYTAHPVIIFDDFTTASKYVNFDFKAKSSAMKILSARIGVDLQFAYERMQLIDFPLGDHKRYWISEYSQQEIMVPDQAEQRAIGAVITDFDHDLKVLRNRLEKARQVRQGMMQQLLTGRTRLPLPEAIS
jgi:type I restriction enzyme S subunit